MLCFSTGSLCLPIFNHLLHGPDAEYFHRSLSDAIVLATLISAVASVLASPKYFDQFPSEKVLGVTRKMLEKLGINRDPLR